MSQNTRAFTLVEALVVITVIAMLIAMLIPSLAAAKESARRVSCAAKLRQLGLAVLSYDQDFGNLPLSRWNVPNYIDDPSRQTLTKDYGITLRATLCPSAGPFPGTVGRWDQPAAGFPGRLTYYYFGGWGGRPPAVSNTHIGDLDTGWGSTAFKSLLSGYGPLLTTFKPGVAKAVPHSLQYLMGDLSTFGPCSSNYVPEMPLHARGGEPLTPEGVNVLTADGRVEFQMLKRGEAWVFWLSGSDFPTVYWNPRTIPSTVTMMP